MKRLLFELTLLAIIPTSVMAAETSYEIESAVNNQKFVINGIEFDADTYCPGWEKGERVIFLFGKPDGQCALAKLYNLNRKEECEVWCK